MCVHQSDKNNQTRLDLIHQQQQRRATSSNGFILYETVSRGLQNVPVVCQCVTPPARIFVCFFFLLLLLLFFGISARNIGKKNKLCNHQMTSYFFISFILSWMFVRSLFILTGRYITRCCFRVIIPADYGEKNIHLCCDLIRSCNVIHLLYIPWHSFYIKIIY